MGVRTNEDRQEHELRFTGRQALSVGLISLSRGRPKSKQRLNSQNARSVLFVVTQRSYFFLTPSVYFPSSSFSACHFTFLSFRFSCRALFILCLFTFAVINLLSFCFLIQINTLKWHYTRLYFIYKIKGYTLPNKCISLHLLSYFIFVFLYYMLATSIYVSIGWHFILNMPFVMCHLCGKSYVFFSIQHAVYLA
jgi:hypothetical protein